MVCLAFIFYHMLTFIHYIKVNFTFSLIDCVHYIKDFVKLRCVKSRFCSINFTLILARLKKIVHYTEDFVIYRGSLNRGSIVHTYFLASPQRGFSRTIKEAWEWKIISMSKAECVTSCFDTESPGKLRIGLLHASLRIQLSCIFSSDS